MASKKYLSLEEAASLLKVKTEELIRLREKGDIRGFADRAPGNSKRKTSKSSSGGDNLIPIRMLRFSTTTMTTWGASPRSFAKVASQRRIAMSDWSWTTD